jgi:tRNA modification GTPase
MPLLTDPAGDLDVIVALATPPGVSALAIVRMTGLAGEPRRILAQLAPVAASIPPLKARRTAICDISGEPLDEVVVLFFEAPASPTGEEVVEISCHGSPAVVRTLLDSLRQAGARPARAGEFSRRALRNGKLDLAKAEGLLTLLRAESRKRASHAYGMLCGHLSDRVLSFRNRILDILSAIEGSLDFSEDLPELDSLSWRSEISEIARDLSAFLDLTSVSRGDEDRPSVVILGRPNAGKSSLFNVLLGIDRAIVTPVPGTTRDAIRETAEWSGERVRLNDTAGLRDSGDEIELIGVGIARNAARLADLVLYVVDSEVSLGREDRETLSGLDPARTIVVFSKADRTDGRVEAVDGLEVLSLSPVTGVGIGRLRERATARLGLVEKGESFFVLERQREALARAFLELRAASEDPEADAPELWAASLRRALCALGEITGETATDDLLDRIFSKFCVGK